MGVVGYKWTSTDGDRVAAVGVVGVPAPWDGQEEQSSLRSGGDRRCFRREEQGPRSAVDRWRWATAAAVCAGRRLLAGGQLLGRGAKQGRWQSKEERTGEGDSSGEIERREGAEAVKGCRNMGVYLWFCLYINYFSSLPLEQ